MDVETAVLGGAEESGRDEEAKGDGDDEVDGLTRESRHLGEHVSI